MDRPSLVHARHVPLDEPIDLLNVAFENPRKIQVSSNDKRNKNKTQGSLGTDVGAVSYLVPDRVTGLMEVEELKRLCPGRMWNFVSCRFFLNGVISSLISSR